MQRMKSKIKKRRVKNQWFYMRICTRPWKLSHMILFAIWYYVSTRTTRPTIVQAFVETTRQFVTSTFRSNRFVNNKRHEIKNSALLSTSGVAVGAIMIITEPMLWLFSTLNDILRYIYMVIIWFGQTSYVCLSNMPIGVCQNDFLDKVYFVYKLHHTEYSYNVLNIIMNH